MEEHLIRDAQPRTKRKTSKRRWQSKLQQIKETLRTKRTQTNNKKANQHSSEVRLGTRPHKKSLYAQIRRFFLLTPLSEILMRVWWVVGFIIGGILIYIFLTDKRFDIKTIQIETISEEELNYCNINSLESEVKNILLDTNYFRADTTSAVVTIQKDPFVEYAVAEKQFPRTIIIQVKERIPYITFSESNGKCVTADSNAYALEFYETDISDTEIDNQENQIDVIRCFEVSKKYETIFVEIISTPQPFELNKQSNQYLVTSTNKVAIVLENYGYDIDKVAVRENYCEVSTLQGKIFLFTMKNGLDGQLKRFKVVHENLGEDMKDFHSLDLRYERPVMK